MFQTADRRVQRPRGRAVSLTGSGGWLEEQGRLAKGVRGGAGEGRAGPSLASQTGELGSPGRLQSKGWSVCTTRGWVSRSQLSHSRAHTSPRGVISREHPFCAASGLLFPLGLSPGLCRLRPRPLLPPRRWRSCWRWTRSGRSPSALLLSGPLSPLCHRTRPVSQHLRWAPPESRPPVPALSAQAGPACGQPSSTMAPYSFRGP